MRRFAARLVAIGMWAPVSLAMVGVPSAFAQFGGGGPATGIDAAAQRTLRGARQNAGKPTVAQPPVLPGTKAATEPAAPTVSPADMSPTDGLFDAINRGDIAAARETINRGAELSSQNVLGLTPLELSVDLGRNDITFLLLSMRGEEASSRPPSQRGGPRREAEQRAADSPRGASTGASRAAARTRIAASAPEERVVATPRLWSSDGGAPIPGAGFVGFNEGRAVR
jgi:hypothetical protein